MLRTAWLRDVCAKGAKTAALVSTFMMGIAGLSVPLASAADLIVYYDQSQLLRMPRPVAEIIIGNPSIADVSIQGSNTLVVTGKTFGLTNIIALDSDRNIIQDQRIIVERDEQSIVNVHMAGQRRSFTCTSTCSPTLTIGDEAAYFESITKQASNKTSFSSSGGKGSSGGGGQGR